MVEELKTINILAVGANTPVSMAFRGLSDEEDEDDSANNENLPLDDEDGADGEDDEVEV